MKASLALLSFLITMLINPFSYSEPGFNGTAPGCGGSGCHTSQTGIVTVTSIGNLQVRVTVTGNTGNVAGEIVDAGGNVVSTQNSTSTNPFILTAPSVGTYTVNAGYKDPARRWESISNVTVPVELVSFTAKAGKNDITLQWITATETNNFGFDIERSATKIDWNKIGFRNGSGNSSSTKTYSYTDVSVLPGKYYYRLKQIDMDGSFEFSPAIEVVIENPKTLELIQNYPNPFNPSTRIQYLVPNSSHVSLKVYNVTGNEVANLVDEYKPAGNYEIEFNAFNFTSGIYFYKLQSGNLAESKKMILLR